MCVRKALLGVCFLALSKFPGDHLGPEHKTFACSALLSAAAKQEKSSEAQEAESLCRTCVSLIVITSSSKPPQQRGWAPTASAQTAGPCQDLESDAEAAARPADDAMQPARREGRPLPSNPGVPVGRVGSVLQSSARSPSHAFLLLTILNCERF